MCTTTVPVLIVMRMITIKVALNRLKIEYVIVRVMGILELGKGKFWESDQVFSSKSTWKPKTQPNDSRAELPIG